MASKAYRDYYSRKAKIQWVRGEIQTTTNGKPLFTGDSRNFKKQEGNEMGIQDGKNLSDYEPDKREEKIRDCEILRDRGLTQKQIAERTGLRLKAVQNILYRLDAGIYKSGRDNDIKQDAYDTETEIAQDEMDADEEAAIMAGAQTEEPEPVQEPKHEPAPPVLPEYVGSLKVQYDTGTGALKMLCDSEALKLSVTAYDRYTVRKTKEALAKAIAAIEGLEAIM